MYFFFSLHLDVVNVLRKVGAPKGAANAPGTRGGGGGGGGGGLPLGLRGGGGGGGGGCGGLSLG